MMRIPLKETALMPMPLFAIDATTEADMYDRALLLLIGNFAIVVLTIVVTLKRTRPTAVVCGLIWFFLLVCLMPWMGFENKPTEDYQVAQYQITFRSMARWWVVVTVFFAFATVVVLMRPMPQFRPRPQLRFERRKW